VLSALTFPVAFDYLHILYNFINAFESIFMILEKCEINGVHAIDALLYVNGSTPEENQLHSLSRLLQEQKMQEQNAILLLQKC
jgi:hypothetical protein